MVTEISHLQLQLDNAVSYIEDYYANPDVGDKEKLGYCKAVIEYLPRLLTLLKLNKDRSSMIQNDDLWKEINRLNDKIQEQAEKLERSEIYETSTIIIKDTHYNKPDPRLIGGDPW